MRATAPGSWRRAPLRVSIPCLCPLLEFLPPTVPPSLVIHPTSPSRGREGSHPLHSPGRGRSATVVCPNFYLAQSWQAARNAAPTSSQSTATSIYAYRATQRLTHPFCVLRDTHFTPPYCPTYAFHASDMFAWFHPARSAAFNFSFGAADVRYSTLINRHLAALVHDGAPPPSWSRVSEHAKPVRDGLPTDWRASELLLPDAPLITGEKAEVCAQWLAGGWYERIGLIN